MHVRSRQSLPLLLHQMRTLNDLGLHQKSRPVLNILWRQHLLAIILEVTTVPSCRGCAVRLSCDWSEWAGSPVQRFRSALRHHRFRQSKTPVPELAPARMPKYRAKRRRSSSRRVGGSGSFHNSTSGTTECRDKAGDGMSYKHSRFNAFSWRSKELGE